jgi:hypothetical protein
MASDGVQRAQETPGGAEMRAVGIGMFEGAVEDGQMDPMDPRIAFDLLETMLSGAMKLAFGPGNEDRGDEIARAVEELVVRAFVKQV